MTERLEIFYKELLKAAPNERRRASLEAVFRAIQRHMLNNEVIAVAAIARTASNFPGAPREQSIRNDASGLKALIELAATEAPNAQSGRRTSKRKDDWIERIPDPLVRSGCRGLHERAVLYQKENDRLRAAILRLEPMGDLAANEGGGGASRQASLFSEEERRAVSGFLDSLSSEGFAFENSGELVSRSGRSVAPPSFLSALRKIQTSGD